MDLEERLDHVDGQFRGDHGHYDRRVQDFAFFGAQEVLAHERVGALGADEQRGRVRGAVLEGRRHAAAIRWRVEADEAFAELITRCYGQS